MSRHHQALMVWIAVLPTLTVVQLALNGFLAAIPPFLRPPVVATVVVPIVVYVMMPLLQRVRSRMGKQ